MVYKWYISYDYSDKKSPDYINTYFYESDNKWISFKELYELIGSKCIKYTVLEGSKLEAYFYIDESFDMNKLNEYDYLVINFCQTGCSPK